MTWGSNVFPLLIVTSSGGFTGLFVYSPAPGAGNLIASVAAQAGTDPFGNSYLAGVISYSPGTSFAGFAGGGLELGSENPSSLITSVGSIGLDDAIVASAQPGVTIGSPRTSGGPGTEVAILGESHDTTKPSQVVIAVGTPTPVTTGLLEVQGIITADSVVAIVAGAAETWHSAVPLLNTNFAAGGQTPRYQFEPTNGGRVRLAGSVNITGAVAASTTMFTLPAGYQPTVQSSWTTANNSGGFVAGNPSVNVLAGGAVQLVPATAAGKFVQLDGIVVPLD